VAGSQDDFDTDLLQDESIDTTPDAAADETSQTEQSKPQHSPLSVSIAQELGIDNYESMTPEALNAAIVTIRRHNKPAATPVEDEDDPVDWGLKEDGTPRTEKEALIEYDPFIVKTHKLAHEARVNAKRVAKENAALKAQLEQERAVRNQRAVERQLRNILAERPDLFGEKPGTAKPGTPEAKRYQLVCDHLNSLVVSKQNKTLDEDARAAMELFGATPTTQKRSTSAVDAYRRAELNRPTQRRTNDKKTPRQAREEEIAAQQAAQNGYLPLGEDDDADLLDA
jgi:hypothetical protein